MNGWIYLGNPEEIEKLESQAIRRKNLWISENTLWLFELDKRMENREGAIKWKETLMVSMGGKIEIAPVPMKRIFSRVRKHGMTMQRLRQVYSRAFGQQQRRFPLMTIDLLLGTLDGSSKHDQIWFNVMHITEIDRAEINDPSVTLVVMRDQTQWVVPRKKENLTSYIESIAFKYRVYVEATIGTIDTFQKTFNIESCFDTPFLRELYKTVIQRPCSELVEKIILEWCIYQLERKALEKQKEEEPRETEWLTKQSQTNFLEKFIRVQ